MATMGRKSLILLTGLVLALLSGCQTWPMDAGITLPSPYYLRHAPQYFPPSPPYPLPKELDSLEKAAKTTYDNPNQ
jgi:hypothetical protein